MQIFETMKPGLKKKFTRIGITIMSVYLIGGLLLYLMQDKILFHPKPLPNDYSFQFNQPFEELNLPFKNNNLNILKFKQTNRKGIVLFYHGNMENVEHYKQYPAFFLRNNYEVWMIDYPGFGKTTGKRTEEIICEQALLLYNLALQETSSDRIVIYGKSIGTGIASYVASNKNCRQLILETPYYSIPSLARHYFPMYPAQSMIRYSFPIHEYLRKIKAPVTILHGTRDEVVPYAQSKLLKKENPKIELVTIEKGKHNNLSSFDVFQRKIDSILVK